MPVPAEPWTKSATWTVIAHTTWPIVVVLLVTFLTRGTNLFFRILRMFLWKAQMHLHVQGMLEEEHRLCTVREREREREDDSGLWPQQ
jgi:hypothetical protein